MRRVSKKELAKIIERHGQWLRGEDGGERADLSGADLSQANMAWANLAGAELSGARMTRADLTGAIMDVPKL